MNGRVLAVHRSSAHSFSKFPEDEGITLVEGLGVEATRMQAPPSSTVRA